MARVRVRIEGDPGGQLRRLMKQYRREIDFATAGALNDTAFSVRKQTVKRWWKQDVTQRNRAFIRAAMRVEKAGKKQVVQSARVFDRLRREALSWQAEGGRRRGRGKRAIPSRILNRQGRTGSGRMRANRKPRAKNMQKIGDQIWRVVRRKPPEYQYTLRAVVNQPRTWKFYQRAATWSQRFYPRAFYSRLIRATRTAR